jgi:tRNA U38,U39,U40 pseudouridine synthase TruA
MANKKFCVFLPKDGKPKTASRIWQNISGQAHFHAFAPAKKFYNVKTIDKVSVFGYI